MTGGGSDANFTSAMGVPTLDGLGADGDSAHTLHEHILVSTLLAPFAREWPENLLFLGAGIADWRRAPPENHGLGANSTAIGRRPLHPIPARTLVQPKKTLNRF